MGKLWKKFTDWLKAPPERWEVLDADYIVLESNTTPQRMFVHSIRLVKKGEHKSS